MRRKVLAWTASPKSRRHSVSRAADAALISLRLTLLIVLSILVVRERWRNRHELPGKVAAANSDVGHRFLERCRRWYHGE